MIALTGFRQKGWGHAARNLAVQLPTVAFGDISRDR
jgi:hypothetical protein